MLPRKRKRRSLKKFLSIGLLVLVLGFVLIGLSYFFIYSDLLKVKNVEVTGNKLIPKSFLASIVTSSVLGKNNLSALLGPRNILFWKSGEKTDVYELVPVVEKISVSRKLLGRKVKISVDEREVFAIWCLPQNRCYGLDEEGVVFTKAPDVKGHIILKINDENNRSLKLLEPVLEKDEWQNIILNISEIREGGLSPTLIKVRKLETKEWTVTTPQGPVLLFSLKLGPANLGSILKELSNRIDIDNTILIDFRVPDKIYYKKKIKSNQ